LSKAAVPTFQWSRKFNGAAVESETYDPTQKKTYGMN